MRFGKKLRRAAWEEKKGWKALFEDLTAQGYRQAELPVYAAEDGAVTVEGGFEAAEVFAAAKEAGLELASLELIYPGDRAVSGAHGSGAEGRAAWKKDAASWLAGLASAWTAHSETADFPGLRGLAAQYGVRQFVITCPELDGEADENAFGAACRKLAEALASCGAELLLTGEGQSDSLKEGNGPVWADSGRTGLERILEICGGRVGAQIDPEVLLHAGMDAEAFLWRNEQYVKSLVYREETVLEAEESCGTAAVKKDGDRAGGVKTACGEEELLAWFQFARAHGCTQLVAEKRMPEHAESGMPEEVPESVLVQETVSGETAAAGRSEQKKEAVRSAARILQNFAHRRDHTESILCSICAGTGELRKLHRFPCVIEAPNWLKDGSMYFNSEGSMYRYDPVQDTVQPVNTGGCVHCNNDHVPSPDNTLLAVSEDSGRGSQIYVTDPATGEARCVTPKAPSYLHGWSPDGKELAYCAFREQEGELQVDIYTVPADGGEEVRRTLGEGFNDGPEYSPDGAHIWFNSTRTGLMQVWRMNRDGSDPQQMTFSEENNWFGHVSPDGTQVAYLTYRKDELDPNEHLPNMQVKLQLMNYDGSNSRTLLSFFGGQGSMNVNSWSPDGRELAVVLYELKHR